MSKILLGKSGKESVLMDLDILLRTRLLIQANSGGGKSWIIRRLAEKIFGKVPIIIIDPEGEFASLREKFPFFLVGKGGDTPADPRSAAILAHRLLELRASAVCDIYELKPQTRHHWVRLFLEALVEAPKNLWGHLLLFLDEAHVYCPQKDESEASGAVVDIATRGRKRGICLVPATQRLAKLSKDVTGELLNRLIGPTFEDVDLERAIDLLAIAKADQVDFRKKMRVLEPGTFQAVGRAFGTERIEVKIGSVVTTHPELGSSKYAAKPPPPPEKIKALLPKLADLPKEAEEKVKTEADLRSEIRKLKADLAAKPAVKEEPVVRTKVEMRTVEVPMVKKALVTRLEKALGRSEKLMERFRSVGKPFEDAAQTLKNSIKAALDMDSELMREAKEEKFQKILREKKLVVDKKSYFPLPARPTAAIPEGELTNPQVEILRALREFGLIGIDQVPKPQLAGWLGIKVSGYVRNNLGSLRTKGLIDYAGDAVFLTEDGKAVAPSGMTVITNDRVFEHALGAVTNPQQAILKSLRESHPAWISKEELAEALGIQTSGYFRNNLGSLHTAAFVEYGMGSHKGKIRLAAWMFVEPVAA